MLCGLDLSGTSVSEFLFMLSSGWEEFLYMYVYYEFTAFL
jgi:hypothetical protein